MNRKLISTAALLAALPFCTQADAVSELETRYQDQGAGTFSTAAGESAVAQTPHRCKPERSVAAPRVMAQTRQSRANISAPAR